MAKKKIRISEMENFTSPIRKRLSILISLIRQNPKLSYRDIARLTNTSKKTAERDLSKLKSLGIIIKQGNTRSTLWILDEKRAKESILYLVS